MGPEQQRLMDRLFNDPNRKLLNFHMTRDNKPCTAEQLCTEVNKAMDQSDRRKAAGDFGDGPVRTGKPRINLRQLLSTVEDDVSKIKVW